MSAGLSLSHSSGRQATHFAVGVALALAGAGLVEALLLAGLPPLTPVGWPGLGMLAGAALGGLPGLAGGALAVAAYYLINVLHPQRFPDFFASAFNSVEWAAVFSVLGAIVLLVRTRLMRLAATEAQLAAREQYEEALRASEERLRLVIDAVPALVGYVDTEQRYRMNNGVYERWLGLSRAQVAGRTMREVWGERQYALLKPHIERALRGDRASHDFTIAAAGAERRVLSTYVPDVDGRGRVQGFFVLASDITELAAARDELRAARERLETALDGSSVALWEADLRTRRVYLSEAWSAIVGGPRADTVMRVEELLAVVHPEDLPLIARASRQALKGAQPVYAAEHRVKGHDGQWRWIISRGRVTERDPATGRALRMIGTNFDITERRRAEEASQSLAHTDVLTGLPNRRALDDRLRLALARAARNGREAAVLFLDLDGFKQVNDRFGHAAGDELLREFAGRLRAAVRATDTVARQGGDEFIVLLEDLRARANALQIAEKIIAEARRPIDLAGERVSVSASVGIAYGDALASAEDLLKRADAALYEAKGAGRNGYRVAP